MWDILKKSDIDEAKQDLKLRRGEILARHAEESQTLQAEQSELETLNRLIDIFTQKFAATPVITHQPVVAPAAPQNAAAKPAAAAETQPQRNQSLSNFAAFTRAMARS